VGEVSAVKVPFRAAEGDTKEERVLCGDGVMVAACVTLLVEVAVISEVAVEDPKGEKVMEPEAEGVATVEMVPPEFWEREGGFVGNEVPLPSSLLLPVTEGDGAKGDLDTWLLKVRLGDAEGKMGVWEGEPPVVGETRLDLEVEWEGVRRPESDTQAVAEIKVEGDLDMEGDLVRVRRGVGDKEALPVREAIGVAKAVTVGIVGVDKDEGDTVKGRVALEVPDPPTPPDPEGEKDTDALPVAPKPAVPVGTKCVAETLVVKSPADSVALLVALGVEEMEEEGEGEVGEDTEPFALEAVMLEEREGRRGVEETFPVPEAVGEAGVEGEGITTEGDGEEEKGGLMEGLPLALPIRRVVLVGMGDEEMERVEV
jgi:hypothetical protein